jgi:hypothetical protein
MILSTMKALLSQSTACVAKLVLTSTEGARPERRAAYPSPIDFATPSRYRLDVEGLRDQIDTPANPDRSGVSGGPFLAIASTSCGSETLQPRPASADSHSQSSGEQDDAGHDSSSADGYARVSQRIGFEVRGCGNAPKQYAEKDKHRP